MAYRPSDRHWAHPQRLNRGGPIVDEIIAYQMMHDLLSLSLFVPEMKACGSRRIEFWDGTGFAFTKCICLRRTNV